jgi:GLPGLI family protein
MKKIMIIIAVLLYHLSQAQSPEGKITYEQKIDMYRRIPKENVQMRSMVPQFRNTKFELQYADNQSLYKQAEAEPDITEPENGSRVVIRMGGENEYYRNFKAGKAVNKMELMGNLYLVEDSISNLAWKLEDGATKKVLGYTCKKATAKTQRGTDLTAWYTEEIPLSSGPDQYGGLPGMILAIDMNNGEVTYDATAIEKKVSKKDVKAPAPSKAKKVTAAEYKKIQSDMMRDGNGNVRIVTN